MEKIMTLEKEQEYLQEIKRVIAEGPYDADWNSLSQFTVPEWFSKAKFGIFIHWGLYSIAAHNNEWYSRNMYIQEKEEWEYHRKMFGEHSKFGYKDFIPLFTAEKFDPDEWVKVFKEAGAKYIFPVAEHHDGFQMYRSDVSKYNAWDMGPGRDLLGELKDAAMKEKLVFCTSSHRAEHWFFMGHGKEFDSDIKEPLKRGDFYWPAMPEPDPQALQSEPYPTEEFLTDWLIRTCEIIDRYQPSLLYFDWWIQHEAFKEVLKKLTAYYYNRGEQWGKKVAICYKHDAMMFGSGIVEVERGALAEPKPFHWQTDTAIAKNSWCYTDTLEYKTSRQIICNFIEIISKNGNMLLNVGPKGDGEIPMEDRKILREIGDWMHKNEAAVFGSRPWRKTAEGSVRVSEGQFTDNEELPYTKEDIRFTANGDSIYAFVMNFPRDGQVTIQSLADSDDQNIPNFHGLIQKVSVLGFDTEVTYEKDAKGLHVRAEGVDTEYPVVFRIQVK
ncbi:alpha-L-fucosidase [Mediterraneibacter agrestimuris]|uniref:alpha-L-fucosidase n=1 Tax=Mediterraneibacter agrestimuris TaxID=2941333 RepID=UPI0020423DAC|nr:alpha-L-fucosidase [Mediterraneibacter agrestimuris]